MEWLAMALDDLIPEDHEARSVWEFVGKMNLSPLYARIAAVEGQPGRNPIDPKILMALWMYATIDGVGSARRLDDLCKHHHAYRWLCGGVSVNYHTLADFRTQHVELLDQLLTESVASLLSAGLIELNRVAAGRDAGAGQRRQFFLPSSCHVGGMLRRSQGPGGGLAGRIGGSRSGGEQSSGTGCSSAGGSGKGRTFAAGVGRDGQAGGAKRVAAEGIEGEGPRVDDRSRGRGR